MTLRLRLEQGEHVFFCGATGSGKTTLAHRLLTYQPFAFAVDTKGQLKWPEFTRFTDAKEAFESKVRHVIFAPPPTFSKLQFDALFWSLYRMGGWTVYIDEAYGLIFSGGFPPGLNALLTRGRELKLSVWVGAQRPRYIPRFSLSEATHFFVFRLSHRDDRKAVADATDERLRDLVLPNYEFAYYQQAEGMLQMCEPISLGKGVKTKDGSGERQPSHTP